MTLFKLQAGERFEVLEQAPFMELERKLEDWIEASPGILFDGEPLAVIARQPRNIHGKFLDLLAVDRRGATVVAELKRGEAPREVLAQAFEYAAWVDSLPFEQLDEIARSYAASKGSPASGLHDLYRLAFAGDEDEEPVDPAVITFNSRQVIVIVAERFTSEVEQTARYFRSRLGVDLRLVRFSVHKAGGETVLETATVVGSEPPRKAPAAAETANDDESLRARAMTEFARNVVGTFDEWALEQDDPELVVEHPGPHRRVRYRGVELIFFYYTLRWLTLWLNDGSEEELLLLRARLARPETILVRDRRFECRLYEQSDVDLIKAILAARIAAARARAPA